MALNTAKHVSALRDLTGTFDTSARMAMPFYPRVCTVAPSNGKDENYGLLGAIPQVREWLGDRKAKKLRAASYVVTNKSWELTIDVEREDIDDDRMGMYRPVFAQTGRRAALHPDKLLIDAIEAAETTACFDGQNFYDTDHSWGDSGTQDNDLAYTATDPDAVTVAEFKAALQAAVSAMIGYVDDQGEPLNDPIFEGFSGLMLMVPPALRQVANEAVHAQLLGGGDTNVVIDVPVIVTLPRLTSGRKFYLHNLSGVLRPFIFQARRPLSRQTKGADDIEKKIIKFMTYARYEVGYLAWWSSVLTTFA